jgi:hypothetical protein
MLPSAATIAFAERWAGYASEMSAEGKGNQAGLLAMHQAGTAKFCKSACECWYLKETVSYKRTY